MDDIATISLGEVKRWDTLQLDRGAAQHLGAASMTLAALRRLGFKTGETYASVAVIAEIACLEPCTVKRHLTLLVKHGWLDRIGRRGHRTPTYRLHTDLRRRNSSRRFALLPRWAAKMLPRWSERIVFALANSRDSLAENVLDDPVVDGAECYNRRAYSVAKLAEDSGLSRQAVMTAKDRLQNAKLLKVDPAMFFQDELGRICWLADSLFLNDDYQIPVKLIEKRLPNPKHTPTTVKKCATSRSKNALDGGQKMRHTRSKNALCSYSEHLNKDSKQSSKVTAEPPLNGSAGVFQTDENQEKKSNAKDLSNINTDERKRLFAERLNAMRDANGDWKF